MTPMLGHRKHKGASCILRIPAVATRSMRRSVRELARLHTEAAQRSKGHAGALLAEVCKEADDHQITLILTPDSESLAAFYARHGFNTIQRAPVVLMSRGPNV
jgi:N-acetylglutamate synthase-like GNAT family acetyltransferase